MNNLKKAIFITSFLGLNIPNGALLAYDSPSHEFNKEIISISKIPDRKLILKNNFSNLYIARQQLNVPQSNNSQSNNQKKLDKNNLKNANLKNQNLKNENLNNADLTKANLTNASLNNAKLQNAKLQNAKLKKADLSGA